MFDLKNMYSPFVLFSCSLHCRTSVSARAELVFTRRQVRWFDAKSRTRNEYELDDHEPINNHEKQQISHDLKRMHNLLYCYYVC